MLSITYPYELYLNRWKERFYAQGNQKRRSDFIYIYVYISTKLKDFKKDEGHYILIKREIIRYIYNNYKIYALNIRTPKYI
jgi:hypothetical protein